MQRLLRRSAPRNDMRALLLPRMLRGVATTGTGYSVVARSGATKQSLTIFAKVGYIICIILYYLYNGLIHKFIHYYPELL